ncbi:hypothetical protein [Cellulomonas hominis]|uniref:hypothetical protein n=1 Tax=Cellulomonas hominis TaxID=156981 RepID=UPI00144391A4|nr:hypothetical protein [Cellulomonas hominis]NKY09927.1 hypothetical protein [Cellulomonas hominis]
MTRTRSLPWALVAVVALVCAVLAPVASAPPARAASAADFDPGNIISDQVFFDSTAMSVGQVQQFLTLKGASCVPGEQPCLKDYRAAAGARAAEPGLCSGYTASSDQSAAEMIVGAARSCGVNPRVLLVLLEKENSLVTRTRPTTRNYQAATGYACPDTRPCDTQYFGLFNQLYMAARQYQNYAANPTRFGYRAGRTNIIAWHPDKSCGSSEVFLANQATAGLYNYTPYRPNTAALANLYGTGDACSSYGNRNFWRLFTDWFGSTQVSTYLLRSDQDATVYLVSGGAKYPIASGAVLQALSPLGSVGYVGQQYLDRLTTGRLVQRALLGPDGTVYYFDAGIRLPFASCAQVADFGMTCGDAVPVEAGIVAALSAGPRVTNLFRTTSGKAFYVQGGARREAADDESLRAAGLSTSGVTLLETGISYLPLAAPVVRDGIVLAARGSASRLIALNGTFTPAPSSLTTVAGLAALPERLLDPASMSLLPTGPALVPLVREPTGSRVYLLTGTGKTLITDPAAVSASTPAAPAGLLERIPDAGTDAGPVFVRAADSGTVYLLRAGELRPLRSWTDLVTVAGGDTNPPISLIPGGTAALLPAGPTQVAPGTLIIAPDNGTVYLADGLESRVTVGSFAVTDELGATRLIWLSASELARYGVRPGMLGTAVTCGSEQHLGLSGTLYRVPAAMMQRYGITSSTVLDSSTCAALPRSNQTLDRFLRTPDGTIYLMENGAKRPIGSYGAYVAAGGTAANTVAITATTASRFPTGARY